MIDQGDQFGNLITQRRQFLVLGMGCVARARGDGLINRSLAFAKLIQDAWVISVEGISRNFRQLAQRTDGDPLEAP